VSPSNLNIEPPLDPGTQTPGVTFPLHFQPRLVGAVALGALFGAPARYAIARALPTPIGAFPFATVIINLSGALLLGLILEALARRGDDSGKRRILRLLAGTGFCGAFTTYSTFAVESDLLLRAHAVGVAACYGAATLLGGLIATSVGIGIAARNHQRRQPQLLHDPDATGAGKR
jgi:fluoride exporter